MLNVCKYLRSSVPPLPLLSRLRWFFINAVMGEQLILCMWGRSDEGEHWAATVRKPPNSAQLGKNNTIRKLRKWQLIFVPLFLSEEVRVHPQKCSHLMHFMQKLPKKKEKKKSCSAFLKKADVSEPHLAPSGSVLWTSLWPNRSRRFGPQMCVKLRR